MPMSEACPNCGYLVELGQCDRDGCDTGICPNCENQCLACSTSFCDGHAYAHSDVHVCCAEHVALF